MQPLLASHRINPQLSSKPSAQAGISLIPAVITIFIFTLLTTQVIIPNQFREQREANIEAITNSAEAVVQAAMAFNNDRSRNDYATKAWPENTNNKADLIPKYLPFLKNDGDWTLKPPTASGTNKGMEILVNIPSKDIREAVVRKIGATAKSEGTNLVIAVASGNHISIDHLTVNRLTVMEDATVKGRVTVEKQLNANAGVVTSTLLATDNVEMHLDLTVGTKDSNSILKARNYELDTGSDPMSCTPE